MLVSEMGIALCEEARAKFGLFKGAAELPTKVLQDGRRIEEDIREKAFAIDAVDVRHYCLAVAPRGNPIPSKGGGAKIKKRK